VYITSRAPFKLAGAAGVIEGVNVQENNCGDVVVKALNGKKVDILINNAGYFYEPVEKITSLNFEEEMKMIDICALGVLRITAAIFNAGLLAAGSKVQHPFTALQHPPHPRATHTQPPSHTRSYRSIVTCACRWR
jgi:NAD(P)-dependent dehydrogenase (short-subunit alcohol dehydrogenase family)